MNRKSILISVFLLLSMFLIIIDTQTAMIGAQDGISLCLQSVIPSLFPFLFLSIVFTDLMSFANLSLPCSIGKFFGIPPGTETLLLMSYLGGYPVGAQCVSTLYRNRKLSKVIAERSLGFCNNTGPAFLFGMVSCYFSHPLTPWLLWIIHIWGSIFAASLICSSDANIAPLHNKKIGICHVEKNHLKSSISAISSICGWVILFRILIAFLKKWILWLFPLSVQTLICGLLELTNGCLELSTISDPRLRFVLATTMLAFGGLCVAMQTASVTSGLSLKFYFLGKSIQTLFSLSCACILLNGNYIPLGIFLFLFLYLKRKMRKNSSNLQPIGV